MKRSIKDDEREKDPVRKPLDYRTREVKRSRKDRVTLTKEISEDGEHMIKPENPSVLGKEKSDAEKENSEMDLMKKMMGFGGFTSTKNKKVEGTDCYGVHKIQRNEYRQYINRKKGFNRPLSPTREDKKARRRRKNNGDWIEQTDHLDKAPRS